MHVLLRHRLLRKPGGFEGSVLVGVGRDPNDPAITKGPDVEEAVPYLGIAPPHPPAILNGGDDVVLVSVKYVFELDMEILERVPVLPQGCLYSIDSPNDSDIRRDVPRVELLASAGGRTPLPERRRYCARPSIIALQPLST